MKCNLVLVLAWMMASVNSCELENDAIQGLYDRFERFRKTKAFDPKTHKTPSKLQYSADETDGTKELSLKINDELMKEFYKYNDANETDTKTGFYSNEHLSLEFKRGENGELIFEDWSNGKKFGSTLRSFDDELTNDFEEDYQKVLLDLKTMRQKMFDFEKSLSKDEIERIRFINLITSSDGFSAHYVENGDGGETNISSNIRDGKETISGRVSCNDKKQKYNVVDGKVAINGEPYIHS